MLRVRYLALAAAVALAATGCGGSAPTGAPPKDGLTDKEKQQVKDLNEQRKEEWKSTRTKQ
ncbi:MAG: hypothetical protein ACKODX_23815 [Gemmata sp.]|jgi:predicted small lipoprotein YifL